MIQPEMTVVVACHYKDPEILRKCLLASIGDKPDHPVKVWQWLVHGYDRMGLAYDRVERIAEEIVGADIVMYAHEDIVLLDSWRDALMQAVADLNTRDPQWALAGAFGTFFDERGVQQFAGAVTDTYEKRFFRVNELPRSVDHLDGCLLIKRPRNPSWGTDVPGFHGYSEDLCLRSREVGRKVWAVNFPVYHACKQYDVHTDPGYQAAKQHLMWKWKDKLPFATTCGVWA